MTIDEIRDREALSRWSESDLIHVLPVGGLVEANSSDSWGEITGAVAGVTVWCPVSNMSALRIWRQAATEWIRDRGGNVVFCRNGDGLIVWFQGGLEFHGGDDDETLIRAIKAVRQNDAENEDE